MSSGHNPLTPIASSPVGYRSGFPRVPPSRRTYSQVVRKSFLADNEESELIWTREGYPGKYIRIGCIGDGSCFFHAISKALSIEYKMSYEMYSQISEDTLSRFETIVDDYSLFSPTIFNPPRYLGTRLEKYSVVSNTVLSHAMQNFRKKFAMSFRRELSSDIQTKDNMRRYITVSLAGMLDMYLHEFANVSASEANERALNKVINELSRDLESGHSVHPYFIPLISEDMGVDIYLIRDVDLTDLSGVNSLLYGGESFYLGVWGPKDMRVKGDVYEDEGERYAIVILSVNDSHFEIVGRKTSMGERVLFFDQQEPIVRSLYGSLIPYREKFLKE